MKTRGAAVASAVVFAFLLALLVFTVAGLAMSQLSERGESPE